VLGLLIVVRGRPPAVRPARGRGRVVLIVALVGVAVNLWRTVVLHGADRRS
jgi:hypothetical protein